MNAEAKKIFNRNFQWDDERKAWKFMDYENGRDFSDDEFVSVLGVRLLFFQNPVSPWLLYIIHHILSADENVSLEDVFAAPEKEGK